MTSLAAPIGFLLLGPVLLLLGPCLFFYLLIFEGLRRELIEEYLWDGVEHLGIVSHVNISDSGKHSIRFAYKATYNDQGQKRSTLYYKDFTQVDELERRLMVVTVLPGKPDSGVPKAVVQRQHCDFQRRQSTTVAACYIASLFVMAISILVGAGIVADITCKAKGDTDESCWGPTGGQYCAAAVVVPALGCFLAFVVDQMIRKRSIPGRVWKSEDCNKEKKNNPEEKEGDNQDQSTHEEAQSPSLSQPQTPSPVSWHQYQTIDDRSELPEEEVWAVLGSEHCDENYAREALATLKILSAEQMIVNDRYREDAMQQRWDERKLLPYVLLFFAVTGVLCVPLLSGDTDDTAGSVLN